MFQRGSRFYQTRRISRQYVTPSSLSSGRDDSLLWPSYKVVGKWQSCLWNAWMVPQNYSQHSQTSSNVAFSLPKWAFHQPNLTLLEPELVTSCTSVSETILYKDWSQFSSWLPLHYHARLWEFRDFTIWWGCLYSFQKEKRFFSDFFLETEQYQVSTMLPSRIWELTQTFSLSLSALLMLFLLLPQRGL